MPTLLLMGPRFAHVERSHRCDGQCWLQVREELVARDERMRALLPQSLQGNAAPGLAYFINGRLAYGEQLFQATFLSSDELAIIHAISGG